jgi:hypothetical protein
LIPFQRLGTHRVGGNADSLVAAKAPVSDPVVEGSIRGYGERRDDLALSVGEVRCPEASMMNKTNEEDGQPHGDYAGQHHGVGGPPFGAEHDAFAECSTRAFESIAPTSMN